MTDQILEDAGPGTAPDLFYFDRREHYRKLALENAFGGHELPDWDPEAGYPVNRPRILALYDYYRDLYLRAPASFLWAGLGRMAGGAVVGGLDTLPGPETFLTRTMVRIGQDIFNDLAWQHEAFLQDQDEMVRLAEFHDQFAEFPHYNDTTIGYRHSSVAESYAAAWRNVASGDPERIAADNRMFLANEQWIIIQPHYGAIRAGDEAGIFSLTRTAVENIHPYHRSFLESPPVGSTGDVIVAEDRWQWITLPQGMLENWVAAGEPERTRLVTLPFDNLLRRDFSPHGRPDLEPPGSP